MKKRNLLAASVMAAFVGSLATGNALAQEFPSKSMTLVVPNPPGGVVDTAARLVSDVMARALGQPVIVDNRGGASGNIAYQMVARAPKDGYTLLSSYSAYHVGNPSLFPKPGWSQSDFVPVGLIVAATNVIAVHPSVPANTLPEFIEYLRKNPRTVNYASQGSGSLSHVGTAQFAQMTKTEITHVPYKGSGPAMQDVLSGQVQMFMSTPPSVGPHVKSGKLKALAVTSKTRHPMLPDVPTTGEAGLPGFEPEAWVGLFAPAGTPPKVLARLSSSLKAALETPEVKQRAMLQGIEPRFLDAAALDQLVKKETDYWGALIKANNITME
ncbi:tripartite tricarboxylate transporter substrate binding protein [Pantoea sp. 18069]|uniref:Bug family tripartite tricarboxylate transporter substrate binding protein n=1 Tax=Pantoea sp. 18069 TaxID=2681415 RepID=UPI001357269A|nr:tripartite tricarboxylate transporter substrate binding protein [Pantoea sp. 18069]